MERISRSGERRRQRASWVRQNSQQTPRGAFVGCRASVAMAQAWGGRGSGPSCLATVWVSSHGEQQACPDLSSAESLSAWGREVSLRQLVSPGRRR